MQRSRSLILSYAIGLAILGAPAVSAQSLGTLTGRVSTPTGASLAGASVWAMGTQREAIVHPDGSYKLSVPAGRYEVRVRLLGYALTSDSVTVTANSPTTKDFEMRKAATNLETVAILGTRGEQRTVMSAPVPIDVLSVADLQQSGRTETAQMLQAVAPSINFPRASIADGTDHIRPATLRGLSPDQALILINGKRRHTSALVNLNGFVGRGSQAVDLNAIPASMIDHIEVLRDGAAAQYGSDAIAGVINIVLKTNAPGALSLQVGENATTYNRDATPALAFPAQMAERSAHDGGVLTSSLNYGWTLGQNGYFQVGGEVRDRAGTNRTLPDTRPQYFAGDPRNANPPAIDTWQGDSYNHDTQLFFNGGQTFANGVELYGFGGHGHRRGASGGMWRRANDDRTVRALYPDGFLPLIKSNIDDNSLSVGLKGDVQGWKWDLGTVYGRNSFSFGIDNSENVSIGNTSKTSFDAGQLASDQSTTTLDLFREVRAPWNNPIRVALAPSFALRNMRLLL
ncbi:MAG TPA: TonB-dependent receptor plug domain-containing protein, partial [Gemmatimonadaceae bacterium]|nr:TonB-dependent receptor plug domain-containing protein [Gemmatimonadaceae bacterium]